MSLTSEITTHAGRALLDEIGKHEGWSAGGDSFFVTAEGEHINPMYIVEAIVAIERESKSSALSDEHADPVLA